MSGDFHSFTLEQVPRSKNFHVDSLATLATTSRENLRRIILVEDYALPAYDVPVPVGVHFTRRVEYYPKTKLRKREFVGRCRGFGYPRIRNYTNAHIQDRTYCVFILR